MSIDTVAGTTSSFCYRTDNVLFLAKHSASFHDANELESTDAGRKVGVDRKGRVIRMKAEKPINIRTREVRTKANGDEEDIKYFPIINGITLDIDGEGTAGGGTNVSIEFYADCIHKVYQRDSSNADPRFANCISFVDAEGNPLAEDGMMGAKTLSALRGAQSFRD